MAGIVVNLTGSHGNGKTELAKAISAEFSIPFFPSRASEIHREFGVTASVEVPLSLRVAIQESILENWLSDFDKALKTGGVFDRCPLDFAAYLLADVKRDSSPIYTDMVDHYLSSCMEFTADLEHLLLCTPHGGRVANRGEDKPAAENNAYGSLIQSVIAGLIVTNGLSASVIGPGSVEKRVELVGVYLNGWFDRKAVNAHDRRPDHPRH